MKLPTKTPLLDRVNSSAELRDLPRADLRQFADELRTEVVDAVSVTGGHLGAGAALEWLTTRVGQLAGTPIALERDDATRPPLPVEHAVVRVAQEALANAARPAPIRPSVNALARCRPVTKQARPRRSMAATCAVRCCRGSCSRRLPTRCGLSSSGPTMNSYAANATASVSTSARWRRAVGEIVRS